MPKPKDDAETLRRKKRSVETMLCAEKRARAEADAVADALMEVLEKHGHDEEGRQVAREAVEACRRKASTDAPAAEAGAGDGSQSRAQDGAQAPGGKA